MTEDFLIFKPYIWKYFTKNAIFDKTVQTGG